MVVKWSIFNSFPLCWHSAIKYDFPSLECMYLFIALFTHDFLFYSVAYNPLLSLFIVLFKLSHWWPFRPWCHFGIPPSFFEHFCVFGAGEVLVRLVLSLPQSSYQTFRQLCPWHRTHRKGLAGLRSAQSKTSV